MFCANNPVCRIDPFGLADSDGVSQITRAIYGETRGLYPQQSKRGSIYDPGTWEISSEIGLNSARRAIGEVSLRNDRVHRVDGSECQDAISHRAWIDSEAAALDVDNLDSLLPPKVTRFYLRQEGIGKQRPSDLPANLKPVQSYGPFYNGGGGDVPKGNRTYIDFYAP